MTWRTGGLALVHVLGVHRRPLQLASDLPQNSLMIPDSWKDQRPAASVSVSRPGAAGRTFFPLTPVRIITHYGSSQNSLLFSGTYRSARDLLHLGGTFVLGPTSSGAFCRQLEAASQRQRARPKSEEPLHRVEERPASEGFGAFGTRGPRFAKGTEAFISLTRALNISFPGARWGPCGVCVCALGGGDRSEAFTALRGHDRASSALPWRPRFPCAGPAVSAAGCRRYSARRVSLFFRLRSLNSP